MKSCKYMKKKLNRKYSIEAYRHNLDYQCLIYFRDLTIKDRVLQKINSMMYHNNPGIFWDKEGSIYTNMDKE